ncbi:hypothetical protein HYX15_00655 [Candidatus Woesearchaeota archaeon]|nr:hypothetical protein [Candidatus Woesearchaeota archaeon]
MTFGIVVYRRHGNYNSIIIAGSTSYDNFLRELKKDSVEIIAGRKDISKDETIKISCEINDLFSRLDDGEKLDGKKELETILKDPSTD